MAHFVLVIDRDPARRNAFLRAAEGAWPADWPPGATATVSVPGGGLTWAAFGDAPIRQAAGDGWAGLVLGYALDGDPPTRLGPAELRGRWGARASAAPALFDGCYAALLVEAPGRVRLGADVLGVFPIYYAASGDVLIASSSPEAFRAHPLFPCRVSTDGLMDLLLTGSPVSGAALVDGVRRLGPGHLLEWEPGAAPVERMAYVLPHDTRFRERDFAGHVALLDEALDRAVRRHGSAFEQSALLLSGGRDSRMLAGYLARQERAAATLTVGEPDDHEARCAARVARTLGWTHAVATDRLDRLPWAATATADWEHLAATFSAIHTWGVAEHLRGGPPACWVGYLADPLIGGVTRLSRLPPDPEIVPFDRILPAISRRAFAPDALAALLRPPLRDLVPDGLARVRDSFETAGPSPRQRHWRFIVTRYERFRTAGAVWRVAFGAWPIMPVLDREVLDLVAQLPGESVAHRRAQDALLATRFSRLAGLPLVTANAEEDLPLTPTRWARGRHRLTRAWRRVTARGRERRYNYRMYDVNGPGWRAVRRLAEPHRARLADLFELDQLARALPPPDVDIPLGDAVHDGQGAKLLVGLLLWAAGHLP